MTVKAAVFYMSLVYLILAQDKPNSRITNIFNGNDCVAVSSKSAYRMCVATEGQMAPINCTADSKPTPALFKWSSPNKDVYSNSSELVIASANHTLHNSDYMYVVVTTKEKLDSRLLLYSSAILTVAVVYSPSLLAFNINDMDNMTVSIKENSRMDMKCFSNGRPTTSVRLINETDPEQLLNQSEPAGDISVDEQTDEVSFTINQAQCEASGVYRCEVDNSLGHNSQSRTLLVLCLLRGSFADGQPLTISITNGRGGLSFRLTAYPTPAVKKVTYLGENVTSDEYPIQQNSIYVECFACSLAPSATTCNINVINITSSDEGFYSIVLSNDAGEMSFILFVKQGALEGYPEVKGNTENKITILVLAVAFGVVAVVVIVVVMWFWRRGWMLPCASSDISSQRLTLQNRISADTTDQSPSPVATEASTLRGDSATALYNALQMEDVGKRSHYEEVHRYQNASTISPYEDEHIYANYGKDRHTYVNYGK